MQLQLPIDAVRDSRFAFTEANRLPKSLRRKLSQEEEQRMRHPDWTASQSRQSSVAAFPASQTWRTEHLKQVYQRKAKLWSGSIAHRNRKRELGQVTTTPDITRSLNVPSIQTDSADLVCGSSEKQEIDGAYRRATSDLHDIVTGVRYSPVRHHRLRGSATSQSVGSSRGSAEQVSGEDMKPAADKQEKLREEIYSLREEEIYSLEEELVRERLPLRGDNSREDTRRAADTSRLPCVSGSTQPLTQRPATSAADVWCKQEVVEWPTCRKPVIPSLAQLTEVMRSCKAFQGVRLSTSDKHRYLSQEYSFHIINKYHGSQIVVDSTEYDNFARKIIRK